MNRLYHLLIVLLLAAALVPAPPAMAQDEIPPAPIENDEGGPVVIKGEMNYTNPLITLGVAQPLIVLEDQAGFVDRNRGFIFPRESQVLGVITGDFFDPPFGWTLSLPAVPQGTLKDVDHDGEEDTGVMTFAVAYWTNAFGDPFLEQRDQSGGGWSTAYATTRVKTSPSGGGEVIGGMYVVWAPDDQQAFPSGFGEDGLLFTEDDPLVRLPAGYTVVDLNTDPFTFDRSREPTMELIEPEEIALDDFSDLSYSEAFDAMVDKMRKEYAFTEYKGIDWDALVAEFRPRFLEAEENDDVLAYRRALRDFTWAIPDGHVGGPFIAEDFQRAIGGGIGIAIRELDDGRTIVNFVTANGPAERAGIELGAEIMAFDGQPIAEVVSNTQAFSAPFSTEHFKRLQQLRYAIRFPLGTSVEVTYRNPGASEPQTVTLQTSEETDSFRISSFNRGRTGVELPVEFSLLDNGLGLVKVFSFSDNELLTVQLWEHMIQSLNQVGVPGLIIDLRQNGGGSGFLADQMAAYFFNEELELGNTGYYDEDLGEFYADPNTVDRFYLPDESLRYNGPVAVIIGPNCASACEFFTYDMTQQNRAEVVGEYPTAGLGGSIGVFQMPEFELLQFTVGRAVDMDGNIHIEGKGVMPTVQVPVTEETLFSENDPLLETAMAVLTGAPLPYGAHPVEAVAEPEIEATPVAEETPAAEVTVEATEEATPAPTEEATPEATEEATPAPTEEATPEATEEATPAPTEEATPEATEEATPAAAEEPTPVATEEPAVERPAGATVIIVAKGGRVLVRDDPSGAGRILGFVATGDAYTLLETSQDGAWIKIDYGTTGGWISAEFAQIGE